MLPEIGVGQPVSHTTRPNRILRDTLQAFPAILRVPRGGRGPSSKVVV